jgi:ribosomal protein S18 acetylase RimI-like enzyme
MKPIERFRSLRRQEGVRSALSRAAKKLARFFVETNASYWSERDLSHPIREMAPKMDVAIVFDRKEELIEWLKTKEGTWMYDPREIKVAVECDHVFPFIRFQDRIIAYLKIGIKKVYIQDYQKVISLPSNCGFCYDIYVEPAYRRMNLAGFLTIETMKYMKQKGYARAQGQIAPWNKAAMGNFINTGFRKYKFVRHIRIFRVIRLYITRYIH